MGALATLPAAEIEAVDAGLTRALCALLDRRAGRSFGICHACRHHEGCGEGGWCRLLSVDLAPEEVPGSATSTPGVAA